MWAREGWRWNSAKPPPWVEGDGKDYVEVYEVKVVGNNNSEVVRRVKVYEVKVVGNNNSDVVRRVEPLLEVRGAVQGRPTQILIDCGATSIFCSNV